MPGLGHLYCGQVRRGLAVWSAVLVTLSIALYAWARWLLVPLVPAAGVLFSWTLLQLALASDLGRFVRQHGETYALRPINHPLAYVAAFLGLAVLPAVLMGGLSASLWVGSVEVGGASMFPHLLPGDRVLFDRRAFTDRRPAEGELVVVAWPPSGRLVARVVATGGRTVALRGGRPIVDGAPLERSHVDGLRVRRFGPVETARLKGLAGYLERQGSRAYVVTYDRDRDLGADPAPVVVAHDEIYVLGDNRDEAVRLRHFGVVPTAALHGRPRHVWASFDAHGAPREGRIGKEVR